MFLEIFTCYNISVKTNEKYLEENIMFYTTGIDIANTKSMWNFLHNHFTYSTMNSWNRLRSIANNVKLYNLNLEGDWTEVIKYLTDVGDCGGLQCMIDEELRAFDEKWYPNYRVGFNGRSSGYLVLYSEYHNNSVLPECVTDYDSYDEFKEDIKDFAGSRVSDFNRELRDAVELVRDFDRLCDTLRDIVNEFSKRVFKKDKLIDAVERFYSEYGDDLCDLNIQGPKVDGDKVRLYDIRYYRAFMDCFFTCFGDNARQIDFDNKYLWLKDN